MGSPLNPKTQKTAAIFLSLFYFSFVLLPILIALTRFSFDLSFDFLSPLFFLLLAKATFFAFLQASLSVVCIALFIFALACLLLFIPASRFVKKLFEGFALLSFSLSPTLVALTLLMCFGFFSKELPGGLWAIVLCHFVLNAAFFAAFFMRRMDRFFSQYGDELRLTLKSFGASKFQHISYLLWPLFKVDFKTWAPQVFLWCFSSFAPIVLLSSGPKQNTPELLLYYSLLNDPSGSRVLVIFILTAFLSYFLNRIFLKKTKKVSHEESESVLFKRAKSFSFSSLILFLLSFLLSFPFFYSLLSPFFLKSSLPAELLNVLIPTLVIFLSSFFISILFGILTILCPNELRFISHCNFISSPMILVGTLGIFSGLNTPTSLFCIALGAFFTVFPWMHHHLRSQVDRISEEQSLFCLSLGMSSYDYLKLFLWPQLRPAIMRIALLISLWSLGEYTFSKALLNRSSTLSLFIEENLRRYQFADAGVALSLSLLLSAIVVTPLLWKGDKRVAL